LREVHRYFQDAAECSARLKAACGRKVYLLAVLMPTVSGIKLGKTICEKDPSALIIYITSSREFPF
jgi:DNA-binding LytR/AlgR family response regulator